NVGRPADLLDAGRARDRGRGGGRSRLSEGRGARARHRAVAVAEPDLDLTRVSELEVAVLAEEDLAPDVQAVAAASRASAAGAGDRAVDRVGGLAGLIPRGRALGGTWELDREQLESFVTAQEPVGMRGRAPDDQNGG